MSCWSGYWNRWTRCRTGPPKSGAEAPRGLKPALRAGQQALQIAAQNQTGMLRGDFDRVERLHLRLKNLRVPSARKERRIGAEQQPVRAGHLQRLLKDILEIEPAGQVTHLTLAAGGIHVDVGAQVTEHESLAKVTRAEMRSEEHT